MTAVDNRVLVEQLTDIRRQVQELQAQRVVQKTATVTAVSTGTNTFTAQIENTTEPLSGISTAPAFMPSVGDEVILQLNGTQPVYLPARLGDGTVTSTQLADATITVQKLAYDPSAYAGSTIYYGSSTPVAPSGGFAIGDMWLQTTGQMSSNNEPLYITNQWTGSAWTAVQDQGISDSLAQAIVAQNAANAKAQIFTQSTQPTYTGAANTAYWIDTANGNRTFVWSGSGWTLYQLGNGAIQPNSLIASNVIATGSITAALLQSVLVLATEIIAGTSTGTHASMQADGFHVYDQDGNEVLRLGTTDNTYFGIVDSSGNLLASIDSTGTANVSGLNCAGDPSFQGVALSQMFAGVVATPLVYGRAAENTARVYGPTANELGFVEFIVTLENSHRYKLCTSNMTMVSSVAPQLGEITVRYTTASGTATPAQPTTSSTFLTRQFVNCEFTNASPVAPIVTPFDTPTGSGFTTYRFLLSTGIVSGSGNVYLQYTAADNIMMWVEDMGPYVPQSFTFNDGSGASDGTPLQQYYKEIAPTGQWTYRGDNTLRTDTSDIVQGWDPSGFNGDGKGVWEFALPNITGTVNRVDLYMYVNLTYYDSGGTAIWNISNQWATANPAKLESNLFVAGYPKPGAKAITLPSSWYSQFMNKTAIGVTAGPSGGTNETYYIRFSGPSARLRVWYTQ